ncbi:Putative Dol-P-Glc:Glc(2)Man(9)GlcNAc(2)-PP-Dol alpha-1,2-glucosyltransferase-like Protein [Tribolium castaneum]|uniref:Dol-P-Glc:Glc(2)Man(9)GlcNAc(2)-PP-Dol alpha-1,2-glucosyltransferase n=2 Tax=Tribolium castaneum TaxID=7070 RepID=D6W779_TRICA|nr:Putative Dol-P-Glc:Glc(2)Man(9)GlcNAc(2)-PP-Dol alpha-1,2-glucosyltransferase-like Protein [Tribolium castaneum]
MKFSTILLCTLFTIFVIASKVVFDKIYQTARLIIDEEFHFQLGEAYCRYEFDKWHPKITTFPGLYLFSNLLLGPFDLCSSYWLRLTSLVSSFANLILFYCLLNLNNEQPKWQNAISATSLSLLPPMYFFGHLYYTDTVSLTMVSVLFLLSQRKHHYFASIFGLFSVLCRQTNIIWVLMAFGCYVLKDVNNICNKSRKTDCVSAKELVELLKLAKGKNLLMTIKKMPFVFWLNATCYGSLLLIFALFVYMHGSIVVGDKTAHEATIHLPQLFYFSLFCLFFAWPHFVTEITGFLKFVKRHKIISLAVVLSSVAIVHFNTLVHPYVLADNRHYIFYIWNRFYGRYFWFRYCVVPVYLFAWFVIVRKLWDRLDVTFLLFFIPCTTVVLVTQKLLEFRYFFIPYVLFRTHLKNADVRFVLCEFVTYCVLNFCTLYIFFNKTIEWENFDCPQRLIW